MFFASLISDHICLVNKLTESIIVFRVQMLHCTKYSPSHSNYFWTPIWLNNKWHTSDQINWKLLVNYRYSKDQNSPLPCIPKSRKSINIYNIMNTEIKTSLILLPFPFPNLFPVSTWMYLLTVWQQKSISRYC